MLMLDSDILIWILRNDENRKSKFVNAVKTLNGQIFITPIQYAEIMAGVRERERLDTNIFLDSLKTVPIGSEAGKLAGEFVREYKKTHNLQIADALIAATTRLNGFQLWTDNKKHYPMFREDEFYH